MASLPKTSKRDGGPEGFAKVLADELAEAGRHRPTHASSHATTLRPIGLGLSGGGIRSATFSLGVLQALAGHGKLAAFDYLSTVSGGGYIGSWLSAWISRENGNLGVVQAELAKRGGDGGAIPQTAEPAPIVWLRKYSNYLTPKIGLFSIDSLALMSIWLRNVLLNLLIVVSFMVALLLIPRLLIPLVPALLSWGPGLRVAGYGLGLILLPLGICLNLTGLAHPKLGDASWLMRTRGVLITVLLPGVLAAIFGSLTTFGGTFQLGNWWIAFKLACASLGVAAVGWVGTQLQRHSDKDAAIQDRIVQLIPDFFAFAIAVVVAINVVFALLCAERLLYSDGPASTEYDYVKLLVFGAPGILVTFGIGGFVFVGLAGRAYFERSREWWGRLNAWFFIVGTFWFVALGVSLYVPSLSRWAFAHAGGWTRTLAGMGWLGSLAATLLGPRIKTLSHRTGNNLMTVLNVAALIVIVGFVVGLATLTRESLNILADSPKATSVEAGAATSTPPGLLAYIREDVDEFAVLRDARVGPAPLTCVAFLSSLCVLLLFGWRVDVNKFSLHNMYKNRLIRCYLGASRRRNPQPFTGFDEDDDLPLASLATQRPLHIVNTSLNLSQGKNLAWQERKAASFVLTPIYCGFSLGKSQGDSTLNPATRQGGSAKPDYSSIPGFRRTEYYSGDDESTKPGFSLGMAMAVSGAAASPNMGATTRPALAFVMTLFNARLGRWTANPAREKWFRASPKFGLNCFLQELFGWSTERRNFIYLSDGGHFENLGLYELVRRRCRTIWIVDGSADPERNCEDLGRAIRQCRVDFGVEIDLPLSETLTEPPALFPKCGFARGTVDYGADGKGTLIYLKPTLCLGSLEPDDVLAYAKREATFPHQTTADQFFDESQFESYRRLGLYIGDKCLEKHGDTLPL